MKKMIINDGFNSELVKTAQFESIFEIPCFKSCNYLEIPNEIIPFSQRKKSTTKNEFIHFYEHDIHFNDFINNPDNYIEELSAFSGVISPDCSLYRDMPFCLQITNIYLNHALGIYMQSKGINVIPNVRWGDERTYTSLLTDTPLAFIGIPKNSIVSIGTYGCIQGIENKIHLKNGLANMIKYFKPKTVLVYGPVPRNVFDEYKNLTRFVHFEDYISSKKGIKYYG